MRAKFPGWYPKTAEEASALWDTAIFVPDANVLLHCLRHPIVVTNELIRLLDALKVSLWIPYQVGLEFHRNRLEVEFAAQDAYDVMLRDQEVALEKARERFKQLRAHPVISVAKEVAALDIFMSDFRARMLAAKNEHPHAEIAKGVERLTALLDGQIGDKWPAERMTAIKKEGEDRYARKIPPGYKDTKKDGEFDRFGDLIIWKDMIEKAKAEKRPVILISDDTKEDWWWVHKGRKLGSRPELVEEFYAASGQSFHIYEFGQFLRFAADKHPNMRAGVSQIEKSVLEDERARHRQSVAADTQAQAVRLRQLEDDRDQIIAALSGTPGTLSPSGSIDREALRARLAEVDAEMRTLSASIEEPHEEME